MMREFDFDIDIIALPYWVQQPVHEPIHQSNLKKKKSFMLVISKRGCDPQTQTTVTLYWSSHLVARLENTENLIGSRCWHTGSVVADAAVGAVLIIS